MPDTDLIIIRGGIIGGSTLYHLSQLYRVAGQRAESRKCLQLLLNEDRGNIYYLVAALEEMTEEGNFTVAEAFAKEEAEDQRRPSGGHVHHRPPCEIDRMNACVFVPDTIHEAINAPDHVGEGEINHKHPQRHEREDS